MQDKPINFNVTDYEKFFGMASSSTLSVTFNKLPLVEYSCSVKEKYPKWFEKAIKIPLPFPTMWAQVFFINFNQTNIPQQIECRKKRIQLCALKSSNRFAPIYNNATLLTIGVYVK